MQVLRKIVVAMIATVALGLLPAAGASAADPAEGALYELQDEGHQRFKQQLVDFEFNPLDERVSVHDRDRNGWGALVELWWGGKLRRWCWNTKGAGREQECNFEIPEGQSIRFFVAEIDKGWFFCDPWMGCGKRERSWAGPFDQSGCESSGYRDPCAFGEGDFLGQA
jgi:hypothetical protein